MGTRSGRFFFSKNNFFLNWLNSNELVETFTKVIQYFLGMNVKVEQPGRFWEKAPPTLVRLIQLLKLSIMSVMR